MLLKMPFDSGPHRVAEHVARVGLDEVREILFLVNGLIRAANRLDSLPNLFDRTAGVGLAKVQMQGPGAISAAMSGVSPN